MPLIGKPFGRVNSTHPIYPKQGLQEFSKLIWYLRVARKFNVAKISRV